MTRTVVIQRGPDVQLLGDAVLIQGAAALEAYRGMTEMVAFVRRRDGIEPSPRLLELVAGLKAACETGRGRSSASLEIAELRRAPSSASLRSGEVVGVEEVARMFGVGHRQARHLAPSLGGWRSQGRGRPWKFDRGLVQAYIDMKEL